MKSFKNFLKSQRNHNYVQLFRLNILMQSKSENSKKTVNNKIIRPKFLLKWYGTTVQNLIDFCNTTCLNGCSMITRRGADVSDRIAWFIMVLIAVIVSLILLCVSWNWNDSTPIVHRIESSHSLIYNVPFPAVTICNVNRISKKKAFELAGNFTKQNITIDQLADLFRITILHRTVSSFADLTQNYTQLGSILFQNNYTLTQLVEYLTPTCGELILKCMWKGSVTRCDSLFQSVTTSEGICCSLNYYGTNNTKYPKKVKNQVPVYPRRVTGCSFQGGVTLLLNPNTDDYFASMITTPGLRLLIHDSYDFPDLNADVNHIVTQTETFAGILPLTTYATNDVKNLKIRVRNCFFHSEKKLEAMQRYSYVNCLAECRSRLIYNKCGCIPDNLPRNELQPTCQIEKIQCILSNRELLYDAIPGHDILYYKNNSYAGVGMSPCKCLPGCNLNSYSSDTNSGILIRKFSYSFVNMFKNVEIRDQIFLHIFFDDLLIKRYRWDIFQDSLAILASFGGLLGLVTGFSIITGLEFLFGLTLRSLIGNFEL